MYGFTLYSYGYMLIPYEWSIKQYASLKYVYR